MPQLPVQTLWDASSSLRVREELPVLLGTFWEKVRKNLFCGKKYLFLDLSLKINTY
jgi:hypothetical protein